MATETKEKVKKDATAIWASKRLGTVELLHECATLTPRDEYARRRPLYVVLHMALQEYRERHGGKVGEKKAGRFGPG